MTAATVGSAGHNEAAPGTAALYATLGDRLLAQLLDLTIVLAASRLILTAIMRGAGAAYLSRPMEFLFIAFLLLLLFGYFILADARYGVTIGKWVAGIRVEPAGEATLSMRRSITRNLWRILDCAPAYLPGAVTIIVTARRQRIGDLFAATVVRQHDWPKPVRAAALGLFALSLVALWEVSPVPLAVGAPQWGPWTSTSSDSVLNAIGRAVTALSLCSNDHLAFDPARMGTQFPSGTKWIVLWYEWKGVTAERTIEVDWFQGTTEIFAEKQTVKEPTGETMRGLTLADDLDIPNGEYTVRLLEDGSQAAAIPFQVGTTARGGVGRAMLWLLLIVVIAAGAWAFRRSVMAILRGPSR
jgi:uncharacterized RDD family membrane protein YckC